MTAIDWYLALNPVQAVMVAGAIALIVFVLLFAICALVVTSDADDDYRASEHVRNITRNKTHGERL